LGHPLIVDVAVIGIKIDNAGGELPRAYVVRRPGPEGEKLTEKDMYEVISKTLAKYKWLEGGIEFIDAIPKNPSGKILKRVLRENAEKAGISKKDRPRL
jgi:acyl-coenzyme A synthetase/AMP-(fatty) acid ligase